MVDASKESAKLLEELTNMENQIVQNQQQIQEKVNSCITNERKYLWDIYNDCVSEEKSNLYTLKEELTSKLNNYYNTIQKELDEEIKPTDKESINEMQTQLKKIREYTKTFNEICEHKIISHNELHKRINFNKLIPPFEKHKFPLKIINGEFHKELLIFNKTQCECIMKRINIKNQKKYSISLNIKDARKGKLKVEFKLQREQFKIKNTIEEEEKELKELKINDFIDATNIIEGNIYICTIKVRFMNYNEMLKYKGELQEFYTFSLKKMQRGNIQQNA